MDCTRCQLLLDDPARGLAEAEAQPSLDACCVESVALATLELGLRRVAAPIDSPSPALDEAILKAAARRFSDPVAVERAPLREETTRSFSGRLRRWVTAPQVAMAMITSLAVVIGVVYVPSSRLDMEATGDTLVAEPALDAPSPPVAASPFPDGTSADTLPPKPEGGPRPSATSTDPRGGVMPEPQRLEDALGGGRPPTAATRGTVSGGAGPAVAFGAAAPAAAPAERAEGYAPAAAELAAADEAPDAVSETAALRAAPARRVEFADDGARSRSAESSTALAPSRSAAAPVMQAAPAPAPAPPTAPGSATATDALLAQARAARSRGSCSTAIPLYDRYLAEASAGPRAEATLELAGCLAATGRTDRASAVYQRATTMPQVASRARQELAAIEARAATSRSTAGAGAATGTGAAADAVRRPAAESSPSY